LAWILSGFTNTAKRIHHYMVCLKKKLPDAFKAAIFYILPTGPKYQKRQQNQLVDTFLAKAILVRHHQLYFL
jgi:hypothetical protein